MAIYWSQVLRKMQILLLWVKNAAIWESDVRCKGGEKGSKKKRQDPKTFSSSSLLLQRVKNNINTELTYLSNHRNWQRPQRSALKHQLAKNAFILTDIGAFYLLSVVLLVTIPNHICKCNFVCRIIHRKKCFKCALFQPYMHLMPPWNVSV